MVADSSSRGSSWTRDAIHVSYIGRRIPYHWASGKPSWEDTVCLFKGKQKRDPARLPSRIKEIECRSNKCRILSQRTVMVSNLNSNLLLTKPSESYFLSSSLSFLIWNVRIIIFPYQVTINIKLTCSVEHTVSVQNRMGRWTTSVQKRTENIEKVIMN